VRWKGNSSLGVKEGNLIALKFHLRRAELFGFEWA